MTDKAQDPQPGGQPRPQGDRTQEERAARRQQPADAGVVSGEARGGAVREHTKAARKEQTK